MTTISGSNDIAGPVEEVFDTVGERQERRIWSGLRDSLEQPS